MIAIFSLSACGRSDPFVVGPETKYRSGPTGFVASPISFNGRALGHASAYPKPQKFAAGQWVYRSCEVTRQEPGYDGKCKDWQILNTASGKVAAMELPGLDSSLSDPGFLWPHVAYVQVGKLSDRATQTVHCVLFDYEAKKIVRRVQMRVPGHVFGTDVEGTFSQPAFAQENGRTVVAFSFYGDGDSRQPLCKMDVP